MNFDSANNFFIDIYKKKNEISHAFKNRICVKITVFPQICGFR